MHFIKLRLIAGLTLALTALSNGRAMAETPAAARAAETNQDIRIQMFDARNGWLQSGGPQNIHVLHTTDGGKKWTEVTPPPATNKMWDCQFLKPKMAWLSYQDGSTQLSLTTNAGKSWKPWTPLGALANDQHNFFLTTHACRMFNARDGLVEMLDGGTCQAVYNFFETHDGGLNWKPATLIRPGGTSPDTPPGAIQIGDCDGSAISYFPPKTAVIANGDLMDGTPKGFVRLSLTTNAGESWRELQLPLPAPYRDGLVESTPPYFSDPSNALMPVHVCKWNADGSHAYNVLIFYATTNSGNSWTRRPVVLDSTSRLSAARFQFVSYREIFIEQDTSLYATQDGAQTWHSIKPRIRPGQNITQVDFVDASNGWLVATDADTSPSPASSLYRTADGGLTWIELPLRISR